MSNFIIKYLITRANNLQGFLGVFIVLLSDIMLLCLSYYGEKRVLVSAFFVYLFIHKIVVKSTKDKISYRVYNGVLVVLNGALKRKNIVAFYFLMILLTYISSLYLILIQFFVGYIIWSLLFMLKVLLYYLCYKLL